MNNNMTKSYKYIAELLPGLLFIFLIAWIAKKLEPFLPMLGSVIIALLLGVIFKNIGWVRDGWTKGTTFTLKTLLKVAIVFLGAGLSFQQIVTIGNQSILIIFSAVLVGIITTIIFAKMLDVHENLGLLIAAGTSICGATAISVLKGTIQSKEEHTAYAISVIFFFNILAVFLYPVIGDALQLDPIEFGVWAGAAVHDTSTSVAVGYMYSDESGEVATTVKLVRTLFLIPLIFVIAFYHNKDRSSFSVGGTIKQSFPSFILLFLAFSILNSVGVFNEEVSDTLTFLAKFFIVMVMAAVGLQVNIKQFIGLGFKPLIIGLLASIAVSLTSLMFIKIIL